MVDGARHLVYVGTSEDGGANTVLGTAAAFDPRAPRSETLAPPEGRRHIVGAPALPGADPLGAAMVFLRDLTADVVEASRVRPGQSVAGQGPNTTGGTLIRPGGRQCYPALWIRDFAMSLECGLVDAAEAEHSRGRADFNASGVDDRADAGGDAAADITNLVERRVIADLCKRDFR